MSAQPWRAQEPSLRQLWQSALYAGVEGLCKHGPDAVGILLLGVVGVAVTAAATMLLGVPAWAGAAATGLAGSAAAVVRIRRV